VSVDDVPHGKLGELAGNRSRQVEHRDNSCGHALESGFGKFRRSCPSELSGRSVIRESRRVLNPPIDLGGAMRGPSRLASRQSVYKSPRHRAQTVAVAPYI